MERTSIKAFNKIYLTLSIITFLISFYPRIDDFWRIILLITALGLLVTTYFLSYVGSIDRIEEQMNKIELDEKLLNTMKDIIILNKIRK